METRKNKYSQLVCINCGTKFWENKVVASKKKLHFCCMTCKADYSKGKPRPISLKAQEEKKKIENLPKRQTMSYLDYPKQASEKDDYYKLTFEKKSHHKPLYEEVQVM